MADTERPYAYRLTYAGQIACKLMRIREAGHPVAVAQELVRALEKVALLELEDDEWLKIRRQIPAQTPPGAPTAS